ncbi:Serine threonine- kinase 16 [Chlorella sorokiniana]|uniref:non-specific serine/threonine protein kinase n=1 Tax=Chlorella sorokiniana TaxID=3076 RepID=A0A2P6TDS4_CHLSO|nr:Serine threonine- kinase 16 [Chlorella sorokiniana]|eukprot:PRW20781.1 Serine threonine- kinase 16 [Chlorella sorokiniana]
MQGWRESLAAATRGCWDTVSLTLGPQLSQGWNSLLDHLGSSTGAPSAVGQEYQLGVRRLRVLRQLGEGGYSFVYLVRDVAAAGGAGALLPSAVGPHTFALKRVLCGSEEQVREAEHEVAVMKRLRHPCLLPLLDAASQLHRTPDGSSRHIVLLLFPVYDGGNLHEFVQRLRQEAAAQQQQPAACSAAVVQQARREAQRAHLRTLLHIFLQWRQQHEAVLMDFGSARPMPVAVRSRSQAMAAQEDAERHCTAPFRAPELWDVPSSCTLDERVDVWSLGCLLYFLLCGQSPFERAAGEAGGSLMLAVVNGRVSWPDDMAPGCPESLKQLVMRCLETDPASRPGVDDVAEQADRILAQLWL